MTLWKYLILGTAISVFAQTAGKKGPAVSKNHASTEKLYQSFISTGNIAQLNLFFKQMPKGGDLHHHFSGTIYAETYLDWAEAAGMLVDTAKYTVVSASCPTCITPAKVRGNTEAYGKLLQLWSNKDYDNHYHEQLPPDQNFFRTFGYFGSLASQNWSAGIKEIRDQALADNISYVETMLSSVPFKCFNASKMPSVPKHCSVFDSTVVQATNYATRQALMDSLQKNLRPDSAVTQFVQQVAEAAKAVDTIQITTRTVNSKQISDTTYFTMRFQTYASRTSNPSEVFASLYAAFLAAKRDTQNIVGINLVSPENSPVALRDYDLHMDMFKYFQSDPQFANIRIALHAGELTTGMVPPRYLNDHIEKALQIVKPRRIGHGVDLPLENASLGILQQMKKDSVTIEINLTSNEFILGVRDEEHPYRIYAHYGVPIVISTDDAGVSRNNLANEYLKLASRYQVPYTTIKTYVYNSIRYSFLDSGRKDRLKKDLDKRFLEFEEKMAKYVDAQKAPKK